MVVLPELDMKIENRKLLAGIGKIEAFLYLKQKHDFLFSFQQFFLFELSWSCCLSRLIDHKM